MTDQMQQSLSEALPNFRRIYDEKRAALTPQQSLTELYNRALRLDEIHKTRMYAMRRGHMLGQLVVGQIPILLFIGVF